MGISKGLSIEKKFDTIVRGHLYGESVKNRQNYEIYCLCIYLL